MVMKRATHPTATAIVLDHIEAWRRDNRWSREAVISVIVEYHEQNGLDDITGIRFENHADQFERARVNAQRVYRWLDESTERNPLQINLIWSIAGAMPEDRRILLINDLLQPIQLHVDGAIGHDGEVAHHDITSVFREIVQHNAEGTVAVSNLLDGIDPGEPEAAAKKLGLMAATVKKARAMMGRIITRRKGA